MGCPYLAEITMSFCRAFPVKKLVPAEHVVESACDGEAFNACPVFREAMARRAAALAPDRSSPAAEAKEGGRS